MANDDLPEHEPSHVPVLDGIWFRRERERIAIGRTSLAVRLGVQAGRVMALEMKKQVVPPQWLPLLSMIGFRLPLLAVPSLEKEQASGPAGPLWARTNGESDERRMGSVTDGSPMHETGTQPPPQEPLPSPDSAALAIVARLEALDRKVEALTEVVNRPVQVEGVPGWLLTAVGPPLTYDAPDPTRTSVCVRLLPSTYARLKQTQARLGLRTTAGAWEYLLRLGLAAAERLPSR